MSADKHLTIPGALEWDSGSVERFTIATLRYAGGSEHDVRYVSERDYDAALAREAALREELKLQKNHFKIQLHGAKGSDAMQQRLTVAEQRAGELLIMLRMAWGSDHVSAEDCRRIDAALKPAAEGEGS